MQREIMTSIPFLSQPSAAAENTEEDLAVAQDLKDTLDAHRNGCVGMAANMIGVPKRASSLLWMRISAAAFS